VGVHSAGRDREAIWDALERREVYGTSGGRTLLWFDLLETDAAGEIRLHPMGSEVILSDTPRFRVQAAGSYEQAPGCPEHSVNALSGDRLDNLCRGECFNPTDRRRAISRIEVVRIRPQAAPGEAVAPLIEDPWRTFDCNSEDRFGCQFEFSDPDFAGAGRDTVYYARALEEPRQLINADGLRCARDAEGSCIRVDPCFGDDRTAQDDLCLGTGQPRAWSSPIFVDHGDTRPAEVDPPAG